VPLLLPHRVPLDRHRYYVARLEVAWKDAQGQLEAHAILGTRHLSVGSLELRLAALLVHGVSTSAFRASADGWGVMEAGDSKRRLGTHVVLELLPCERFEVFFEAGAHARTGSVVNSREVLADLGNRQVDLLEVGVQPVHAVHR